MNKQSRMCTSAEAMLDCRSIPEKQPVVGLRGIGRRRGGRRVCGQGQVHTVSLNAAISVGRPTTVMEDDGHRQMWRERELLRRNRTARQRCHRSRKLC